MKWCVRKSENGLPQVWNAEHTQVVTDRVFNKNEHLIAAAPEMLEALQGVQVMINCGALKQFQGEPWLERVSLAISKAKGLT